MSARTTTTTKSLCAAVEVERSLSRLKPVRPALGSGIRPERQQSTVTKLARALFMTGRAM